MPATTKVMIMRKTGLFIALLAAVATFAGCGGGSEDDAFSPPPAQTPDTPAATVSSLTVTTDTATLPSDGSVQANIKVYARDASNRLMSGVPIVFSATSGALNVVQATTDLQGVASATLAPLSSDSRVVTVTAAAGATTGQVAVSVDGSTIDIQGPDSLITNTAGDFTVSLVDSANHAITGKSINISTTPTTTLSSATLTTDANGRATFKMTPTGAATVTITAAGGGESKTKTVTVSSDSFSFTAPGADTVVQLGAPGINFEVNWLNGGVPVANGQTVTFSTTRGQLSAITTTSGGKATANLQSGTAGEAVVTATNSTGGSTQRRVVFVASQAASMSLQANPFTVGINQSSTLTATVRDASNNLVAGKTVIFSLNDPTGGSLNVGSAVTDSLGRARTVYTASSATSAANGVHITATVQGATPAVTGTANLTVAGSPLFLAFGTGNTIEEINADTQYRMTFVVQVTDSNGNGVPNAPVNLSALHWNYVKGNRRATLTEWVTDENAVCVNEDRFTGNPAYDYNGVLDPGENQNGLDPQGNLTLESGNIAAISPASGVTDQTGSLNFTVTYPQNYAYYIYLVLRASTAVQGTEFSRTSLPFLLPGAASDFNNITVSPPGMVSPFGRGVGNTCGDFN